MDEYSDSCTGPGSGLKPAVVANVTFAEDSNQIADLPLSSVDGRKTGSAAGTATTVKATVAGSSIATQFLETVEDYLQNRCLQVLTPLLKRKSLRLACLRKAIDEYCRQLLISEVWLAHQEYLPAGQITIWKKDLAKNPDLLRAAKQEFWKLNCPSLIDCAKLQALEEAQYLEERKYKAAEAQVWAKLCHKVDIELEAAPLISLTRPVAEHIDFGTKDPKPVGPKTSTGPADNKEKCPKKKACLNQEHSWCLKEAAEGYSTAPADMSADKQVGEQVWDKQDSTEQTSNTDQAAEKTQGQVEARQEAARQVLPSRSRRLSRMGTLPLTITLRRLTHRQRQRVTAARQARQEAARQVLPSRLRRLSSMGTLPLTMTLRRLTLRQRQRVTAVEWEEEADTLADLENLQWPARTRQTILDCFPKKHKKHRRRQKSAE
eukprot:2364012-Rhodomonas_salina.2